MCSLVIGASGLIGRHLWRGLNSSYVVGTYYQNPQPGLRYLNMTDPLAVRALCRETAPDVIYIAGAQTNVDICQRVNTNDVNVNGVLEAASYPARLVWFSSDYVFDGRAGPYGELAARNPLNVYGLQKLAVENVLSTRPNTLIIRTSGVFGVEPGRKNFVYQVLDSVDPVSVPDNVWLTPTYAPALVKGVLANIRTTGIIHLAGAPFVSKETFAREILATWGFQKRIVTNDTTPIGRAARPLSGGLISSMELTSWKEGLEAMRKECS